MIAFPYNLIAGAAVIAGVATAGWYAVRSYNSAIKDSATAQEQASRAAEALDVTKAHVEKLQEMGRMSDDLGRKALAEAARERKQRQALEEALQNATANDPSARSWLDAPVPASVRGVRRSTAGPLRPGGALLGPDGKAPADAGAGIPGRDQPRPAP